METMVSMLQEDAVALATASPPPKKRKYRPCWCPQRHPSGAWGAAGVGGSKRSRSVSEEDVVTMAGPQTGPLSARGWPRWLCGCSLLPPLPTSFPHRPWGCHGSSMPWGK